MTSATKPRESALRLKRFQVQEKGRQVSQIETMIGQFEAMSGDLTTQIAYEEKKAGIDDVNHFAYPTFAKAARLRLENIQTSIAELNDQLTTAQADHAEAQKELAGLEGVHVGDDEASQADIKHVYSRTGA